MSNIYFNLASGSLTQDWSNTGLITANDNWSGVPSIEALSRPTSPPHRELTRAR